MELNADGTAHFQFELKAPDNELLDRPLALRATAIGSDGTLDATMETPAREVESEASKTFSLVRFKVRFLGSIEEEWYKDEGGKENCIEADVCVVNAVGQRQALGTPVPLEVRAHYAASKRAAGTYSSGGASSIISMLPLHDGSTSQLDPSTGEGHLRVRFNEVSSKHGQQPFCIRCGPAAAEGDVRMRHIGWGYSSGVKVKSKRHGARRKQAAAKAARAKGQAIQTPGEASGAGVAMGGGTAAEEAARAVGASGAGAGGAVSNGRAPSAPSSSASASSSSASASASAGLAGTGAAAGSHSSTGAGSIPPVLAAAGRLPSQGQVAASPPEQPSSSPGGAANGVVEWTNEVFDLLGALQWRVIGFETDAHGVPDRRLPLLRCPACYRTLSTVEMQAQMGMGMGGAGGASGVGRHNRGCRIERAIKLYLSATKENLHVLLRHIHGDRKVQMAMQAMGANANVGIQQQQSAGGHGELLHGQEQGLGGAATSSSSSLSSSRASRGARATRGSERGPAASDEEYEDPGAGRGAGRKRGRMEAGLVGTGGAESRRRPLRAAAAQSRAALAETVKMEKEDSLGVGGGSFSSRQGLGEQSKGQGQGQEPTSAQMAMAAAAFPSASPDGLDEAFPSVDADVDVGGVGLGGSGAGA